MLQRYWTGVLDGTELLDGTDPAGFELTGAGAFAQGAYVGSITKAADGYPHKLLTPILYGQELELKFLHIPAVLLDELLAKLQTRNDAGEPFPCTLVDGFQTIEGNFQTGATPWYDRGQPDGDYVQDATIRLSYTGA